MDKIGPVIEWIKKNAFWLASGIVSILMIAMWFVTTGTIDSETEEGTRNVTTSVSTAQGILKMSAEDAVVAHPNDSTKEGMKKEMEETINAIVAAWKKREADQKEILVWPKVIPNERFVKVFGRFNPPETFPKNATSGLGEFEDPLLLYKEQIPKHMEYLCSKEQLNTNWKWGEQPDVATSEDEDEAGGGAMGGRGGGMSGGFGGEEEVVDPLSDPNKFAVMWSDTNQVHWNDKIVNYRLKDDNNLATNRPTPLQCYMIQQDLWLLEAMFKIIKGVNGSSNANDLSKIKTIDHIAFGRNAGKDLGALTPADARLGDNGEAGDGAFDPMMGEEDYDEPDYDDMMDNDMGMGMGMGGMSTFTNRVPYDERYVDSKFQPIPEAVVYATVTGAELPAENLELLVAKRVPVRIALRMDERVIGEFMAACANSDFAFEIQQVRWNKHTPGGSDITGQAGGGGGSGFGGRSNGNSLMGGGASTAKMKSLPIETRTNYDVNVEFYGIVKIYNPVRESLLRAAAGLEPIQAPAVDAAPSDAETTGAEAQP